MLIKIFFRKPQLFLYALLVFAVGCAASDMQPSPTATAPPPTRQLPTVAPTVTATVTPLSTLTPPTITATPIPSPTATLSPLPTLSPEEVGNTVSDLFQNNAGCLFPCWWGIVPGETEWSEAERFLQILALDMEISRAGATFGAYVYIPDPVFEDNSPHRHYYRVKDSIIEYIKIPSIRHYRPTYHVSAILTTYGQPSEIWVIAASGEDEHWDWPASVYLFYPEYGFALSYSTEGYSEGDYLRICLSQDSPPPTLLLWNHEQPLTFAESVEKMGFGHQVQYYLPLDEVADMSVEEFYQVFTDPDNEECLETFLGIWQDK